MNTSGVSDGPAIMAVDDVHARCDIEIASDAVANRSFPLVDDGQTTRVPKLGEFPSARKTQEQAGGPA